MFDTLRSRFILSHTLPLLLLIPLAGLALVYFLESQVLLPNLAHELTGEGVLLADIASTHPQIWSDPAQAQELVDQVKPYLSARVMLLDAQGRLLAASDPAVRTNPAQVAGRSDLSIALGGAMSVRTDYSQSLDAEVADVFIPIQNASRQVLGVIRLTQPLADVYGQFLRLRYFVAGILGVALLLGGAMGLVLALNLERPLHETTQAVYRFASVQEAAPLPEQGTREIRVLSHAFNFMMERLRDLEEARRQLLANLVHELSTPLGAMNAAVQALRGGAAEDPALREDLLVGVQDEIAHLRRLVDDLTRFYDQVLGSVKLNRQSVSLDEWLPRVTATWREAALRKGLHWETEFPPQLPMIRADPDRLAQVFGNLLSNAIKYTPAGGTVTVAATTDEEVVHIRVSDTGGGISSGELALIFTPFYRGNQGGHFTEGMGLGLTIARDLARAHGGELAVESIPGRGSTFTLTLPITSSS